jgi:hypothetical protein
MLSNYPKYTKYFKKDVTLKSILDKHNAYFSDLNSSQ